MGMDKTGTAVYLFVVALGFVCSGFLLGSMWTLKHVVKG